jgi:hypothetical protein
MMKQFKQFEEFNIVKSTTQAIFRIGLLIQFFLLGFRRSWEKSAANVLIPIMGMMFFIAPFTSNAQTETFNTGSYIINMGIVPQTMNNGLKPYGLIYDLIKNNGVVVKWVISPTKVKDGEDFNYNGTSFKGGTFIIPKEYRNTAVNNKITSYGVSGTTTTSPLTVNVTYSLNSVPTWTLDQTNGSIAQPFFTNAGIPSSAYNNKLPSALAGCDDIFVMPHADPAWSTHNNLRTWNLNHRGAIWAGCNAVSHLENLNNGTLQMNFLANNVGSIGNALVPDGSHADGTPPYNHNHPTSPVSQYMGSSDGAHTNGAEQVYLPKLGGSWRSTTQIIANDPTQSNVPSLSPGPAAIIAFGRGFGDANRGWVMYEAGHNINNDGTVAERVAAQRAFFNFSFLASIDKVPKVLSTNIPTLMSSLNTYTLSVTANSPAGSSLTYLWSSSCGGTFTPTNASSTTFTAPSTANLTSCIISCKITDACGRITTSSVPVTIRPIETDPDMNATLVNVSVPGNVNTNDDVPPGTTYGTPNPIAGNPPGGVIVMNPNGTYTFISPNIGEYNYLVPVCPPGVTGSNCLLELLTITVTQPYINTEAPTANPDVATTMQNTPVTVSVLTNDACNNGPNCTLSNPTIVDAPNNGTVTVNANGTVTYTPNTNFIGLDTFYYRTCDNQLPAKCDTAEVFITVNPTGSPNVTAANDDFETGIIGVPVTGNALTNDTDPEGHAQTATTQNVTNANGTFVLNANGTFTFTPAPGFTGPVSYPYSKCDNGTPTACDTATIYILIEPILETDPDMNATLVNVSVPGNVNTNDDVPAGTTYGTPNPIAGNPPGGVIVMNPNGTYTFISPNIGEYNYLVPVCPPGVTGSNCLLELLTITVTQPYINTEAPTANPDVATTMQNTPVTVSVLTNDACNNGPNCTLSNPTIVDAPNNGTVTVNANGTVTYTPNTNFIGLDTFYYRTCDNQLPAKCDTAEVFITVNPTGSPNVTAANDDFETGIIGVPVTGNALTNDTDPEGHAQTATTQNVTNANGTFVLNANGTFTFTPAPGFTGPVSYPYSKCDNGTPTACDTATIYILIEPILETDPDMNATLVNVSVPGNVNTNDDVPAGTTYGTPNPIAGNPPGGVIVMNPNGTYTFISPNIGEYNYLVPVCAPGVTGSNCLLELLTITVTQPYINTEPPTANPDIATTLQNTPVTVSVLTNDACNNGAGCTLSNPNIVDPPNNGTVTVNANGTVTYTPNTGFVGIDTLYYSTCDNQQPPQCDTAGVFITVIPTGSANVTAANDDFETGIIGVPVTGNALTNDTDPEGHVQTATTQNVTNANGTFVLNANGTFTFTPAQGFTGPVSYPYTVCDNGTPTACDTATIYILIEPIIETDPDMNATLVNVSVPGNVNTNDDVPAGTTYGTPNPIAGNPPGGVIVMNPNGTYTFISPNIGEYNYLVPVCAPGVTGSNCLLELLTITVTAAIYQYRTADSESGYCNYFAKHTCYSECINE